MTTQEEVLQYVEDEGVKFIRLAFFDLFGVQKNVSVMPIQLQRAFEKGVTIDGSQVFGSCGMEGTDLIIKPDPSTMMLLPWRSMENGVIHMLCDLFTPDGRPFEPDPRRMLKSALWKLHDQGIDLLMASKFQFYLFERDEKGHPTHTPFDHGGYMDVAPKDRGENIRREICLILEEMGLDPHKSYHQQGPGQNEIDFHFSDPLSAADEASIFKWVVETCAATNGLYADFSPKPLEKDPGSAMHVQLRFENEEIQEAFLAGLVNFLPQAQLFLCPDEKSIERLAHPSSPNGAEYSRKIRNVMVRVPSLAREVLEVRLADSNANPYLAFAIILECGLKGVEERLSLQNAAEASRTGLAGSLQQAKIRAAGSPFVREILHPDVISAYLNHEDALC